MDRWIGGSVDLAINPVWTSSNEEPNKNSVLSEKVNFSVMSVRSWGLYVPCWEIDLSKVDIESSAPDGDPLDSFEGFAGGQSEDEVLGAVIRPENVGGPLHTRSQVCSQSKL